jgi:hypothetical protein
MPSPAGNVRNARLVVPERASGKQTGTPVPVVPRAGRIGHAAHLHNLRAVSSTRSCIARPAAASCTDPSARPRRPAEEQVGPQAARSAQINVTGESPAR